MNKFEFNTLDEFVTKLEWMIDNNPDYSPEELYEALVKKWTTIWWKSLDKINFNKEAGDKIKAVLDKRNNSDSWKPLEFEEWYKNPEEETPTTEDLPDNESPINGIEEEPNNDLTKETSLEDSDRKIEHKTDLTTWAKGSNLVSLWGQWIRNKLGKKGVKKLVTKLTKWLNKFWKTASKSVSKFMKTPWAIQTVVNTVLSTIEAEMDRKEWLTKDDALSMASDFVDNFLLDIPSWLTHVAWGTPYWENETIWEQQAQVEKIKKDEETRDKYSDMWWWWFWNLLWTSATEWWYLKEDKNIKNKYWWNASMYAEQQLSAYAADKWKLNDSKLKKDLIDKWYKFQTVKDKNTGEKYQTWVNKEWKTLLNKKQLEQTGKKDFRKEWETINI